MYNPRSIFDFMRQKQADGQHVALVTIAEVSGSSARGAGAHMAVSADGAYAGSLSGGCVEAAVAAEAVDALTDNMPRMIRYGEGSPFIDIRLPCGGGMSLLITPVADQSLGEALLAALVHQRKPMRLLLPMDARPIRLAKGDETFSISRVEDALLINHIPPLRLGLFGDGATVECLRRLANVLGAETVIATPDKTLADRCTEAGAKAHWLKGVDAPQPIEPDAWSAAVTLFHDHERELGLLADIARGAWFYIGAMGSCATHAKRSARLLDLGVSEAEISRISAPIGLIPSMRDPETLAVSIIAEIMERYNNRFLHVARRLPPK